MPKKTANNAAQTESSFPFIVSNGPGTVKDPHLRTLIRKQAMKDIGLARKRRGNYGKANKGQILAQEADSNDVPNETVVRQPDSSSSSAWESPETTSTGGTASTDPTETSECSFNDTSSWTLIQKSDLAPLEFPCTLSWPMSFDTGYERVRTMFCVDLTQLSLLTNFSISKTAIKDLAEDPLRLPALMEDRQWSYLEYVPQMYDSSKILAAATDCVLAKVSNVLVPFPERSGMELRLYTKALRLLQDAIADPISSIEAETLCAIQLMSIHELLDASSSAAWSFHVKGSARLVKHRTPSRFKSEFEKALFAGHVGPIVSEALMAGEACYLAEPEWMELYDSVLQEGHYLTERSQLAIDSRKLMFTLPGLWADVDTAIKLGDLFDDGALSTLEARCREAQREYLVWLEEYKSHVVRTSLQNPHPDEIDLRRELFGATLECLCVIKRLLASVCDESRLELEPEIQALAKLMLELQDQPKSRHSWLFSGHEVGVSYVAQITREQYEENVEYETLEERRLAMRRRYLTWEGLLRSSA